MIVETRFRVLGAVGITVDALEMPITASRQRALLALLMLDANRSLPSDVLIEGIWGERIPQHPEAALQIAVSRLRTAMGAAGLRIISRSGGYALVADDDELDLLTARRLYADGQNALAHTDGTRAAVAFDGALRCWSGDALLDVGDAPFCDTARHDLHELRLAIYEARNDAYLLAGRHVEVLAGITAWVRAEPWRERLREQQMLALYRAGRQVDALAIYEELRVLLRDELGLTPSDGMRELHAAVLRQDPSLRTGHVALATALPPWTPSALPFVGRGAEEEQITKAFRSVMAGDARLVLVDGEAGIGKSRLLLELARRFQDQAIVVAVSGNDTLRPAVDSIGAALADATSAMPTTELRHCLGRWPGDAAFVVPSLRERFLDLPPALSADPESVAQRLRNALVSWVAAVSQRAPVVLLVDDLHLAGPGMLTLIGEMLADPEPKRVLVLANARAGAGAVDRSARLDQLIVSLRAQHRFERVTLSGLDEDAIRRLLTQMGRVDGGASPAALHRLTDGHPFLLGEVLQDVDFVTDDPAVTPVPERARRFVLRRAAALGNAMTRALGIAATTEQPFDIPFLAELSNGTVRSTAVIVDQAVDAGFLRLDDFGSFDFVHQLSRQALEETVVEPERGELHRQIALALESRTAPASWIATHWSRAVGPDSGVRTLEWASTAGEDAMRRCDPGGALGWYEMAVAVADNPRTRGRALVRLADAQWQAGGGGHIASLTEAVHIARSLGDSQLLVEAASVWTPVWSSMPALERKARIALLREASTFARDDAVRGQLLGRLAAELVLTAEQAQARPLSDEAIACTRRSANRAGLPEVLMRHFYVAHTPHMLQERQRNITEALAITHETNDLVGRFFALGMAATSAIEAAQPERADTYLDAALELADRLQLPMVTFNATSHRAWRAGLRGDLAEAEMHAIAAGEIAARHGVENSRLGTLLQLGCIRWQQDRLAELVPVLRAIPNMRAAGLRLVAGRALVESAETRAESAEQLARAATGEFAAVPFDMFWSTSLIFAAETAFALQDDAIARTILRLLRPFADQIAFVGNWVVAPISYGAAVAAAGAGDASADELFEQAINGADQLQAPLLRARAELAWGQALLARSGSPSVKVLSLVDDAREILLEHGVERGMQRADALHVAAVGDAVPLRGRRPRAS